jgi:hypothetical protein
MFDEVGILHGPTHGRAALELGTELDICFPVECIRCFSHLFHHITQPFNQANATRQPGRQQQKKIFPKFQRLSAFQNMAMPVPTKASQAMSNVRRNSALMRTSEKPLSSTTSINTVRIHTTHST